MSEFTHSEALNQYRTLRQRHRADVFRTLQRLSALLEGQSTKTWRDYHNATRDDYRERQRDNAEKLHKAIGHLERFMNPRYDGFCCADGLVKAARPLCPLERQTADILSAMLIDDIWDVSEDFAEGWWRLD